MLICTQSYNYKFQCCIVPLIPLMLLLSTAMWFLSRKFDKIIPYLSATFDNLIKKQGKSFARGDFCSQFTKDFNNVFKYAAGKKLLHGQQM